MLLHWSCVNKEFSGFYNLILSVFQLKPEASKYVHQCWSIDPNGVHSSTLLSLENQFGKRFFKTENQPALQFSELRLNPFLSYQRKGWKTKTSIYYYKNFAENQNVTLLGSKFRIEKTVKLKNWKPNFSLEFNNLFNTKWYSTILNSDSFTFIDKVEAIPPFVVFSFDYTF